MHVIRQYRKRTNQTQAAIAKRLRITQSALSNSEKGRKPSRNLAAAALERLLDLTSAETDALVTIINRSTPSKRAQSLNGVTPTTAKKKKKKPTPPAAKKKPVVIKRAR